MANVRAAASESKHTYEAYVDAGIINTAKTFVIPVFNNMPNANLTRDDVFKASVPVLNCTSCNTTALVLEWSQVDDAEGYKIYRLDSATGQYVELTNVKANVLKYKDTLGSVATKATYRVIAYKTAKDGSVISSKYKDFEATTATETPTNLNVTATSDNSVSLSWTGVANCHGYRIYRYDALTNAYKSVGTTKDVNFVDSTALSGTDYKYKVRAYIYYTQNFYSGYSNEVSAKTTGEAVTQIGKVNVSDSLNVRAEADASSTVIVQLQPNTQVYIINRTDEWYKIAVTIDGVTYTGYAHSNYIVVTNTDVTREQCPYKEPTSTLKNGSTGEGVKWLQWHLYKLGYLKSSDVDGDFGPTTLAAVKKYQTDKKLEVDGVVGSGTRGQLIKDYNAL